MAWDGVLVRFGELGIKSAPVRRSMLATLQANLLAALERQGVEGAVERLGSRLWLVGPDAARLASVASRTFGVVSASPAAVRPTDLDAVCQAAVESAMARTDWRTFAVRARREGDHPFSSQDVAVAAGSAVWQARDAAGAPCKVDLGTPDLEVHVDIRGRRTFVFTDVVPGPGGLPVGTQGTVVALFGDEPSAVAAWLMMRRGCRLVAVHAGDTGSLPIAWAGALVGWGMEPEVEVLPVCSGTVTKQALLDAASTIAMERGAQAVVTGERTHAHLMGTRLPVLRPVCGMDAGTYDAVRARVGLPDDEAVHVLASHSVENVESLLSMRRQVRA